MNTQRPRGDHPDAHPGPGQPGDRRPHRARRPGDCRGTSRRHRPDAVPEPVLLGGVNAVLTAVPYLLGFHPPQDSMVLVGIQDVMVRTLLVRGIPTAAELVTPDGVRDVWGHTEQVLDRNDCNGVIIIAHADTSRIEDLHHVVDAAPVPVLAAVRVADRRWWTLECPHPAGCTRDACTPSGQVLPDDLEVSSTLIALGRGTPGSRADLEQILRPGPAQLLHAVAAHLPFPPGRGQEELFAALTEAHAARAERPQPLDPAQAAVLLHALTDAWVRDACLAWDDDAAWWLWTELVRTAPTGWVAPVASVIAVLAYQRGDGVIARIAAEHALLDQPGYNLARLVLGLLRTAATPTQVRTLIADALAELPPPLRPGTTP